MADHDHPSAANGSSEHDYVPFSERPLGVHSLLLAHTSGAGRILDAGCSAGYLSQHLVERGSSVVGIDANPDAAKLAERYCERVLVGNVEEMEWDLENGSFDAIVCGDLIEHLRDPGTFLERVRPLLAPGGLLVLSTPNIANWAIRLSLLFGRWRYAERGIMDRTHTHLFTQATLAECLRNAGYEVCEIGFTLPLPGTRSRALHRAAHRFGRIRPQLFAYQFVAVARPASGHRPASARA